MSDPKQSQESISAAQQPEQAQFGGFETPPPKKRNTTPPPPAAATGLPVFPNFGAATPVGMHSFGAMSSDEFRNFGAAAPPSAMFGCISLPAPPVEVKLMHSDAAYDQAINFGGNLTLARICTIIDGVSASGGVYCSIKNKYFTREMIDKLREAGYHFHVVERQACPNCELPINVDGYICWCKGVIHDTPGIVIKNMCSCIAH